MLTRERALIAKEFHYGECLRTIGPRGGVTICIERWRRNGATQTWKTRPTEFRVPVKFGLKSCHSITHLNCHGFHAAEDCPLLLEAQSDDKRRLYGLFLPDGRWGAMRKKREVIAWAKDAGGYVTAMPDNEETWDAPTFRACSDIIADFRGEGQS